MTEWAVYQAGRNRFRAVEYGSTDLPGGCLALDEGHARHLARVFIEQEPAGGDEEEIEMAKAKKGKRAKAAKTVNGADEKARDLRVPAVGSVIRKEYKGKTYEVRVNEKSFTYDGKQYTSLSAVSHLITGKKYAHGISGFVFFKKELAKKASA